VVDTLSDPAGHVGYFLLGYVPDPHTLFKKINALSAGTTLWIDGNIQLSPKPFFSLKEALISAEDQCRANDPGRAGDELRDALLDSVAAHLVADVPVGVFLSSGVDSPTLAALAKEAGAKDMRSITLASKNMPAW
jgi:asparagine synthase (glutamine-hydrolysing)